VDKRADNEERGTGRTTTAMRCAKQGAVYVWWCNELCTPRRLAAHARREDLLIVGPSWLRDRRWEGLTFPEITLDHATRLTDPEWKAYWGARTRVRE
jgi:hypothetical protein